MASAPVPAVDGMASTGSGGSLDLQTAADALQIVLDRGALLVGGHRGGRLGQVDGRAAADGQQEIALGRPDGAKPCRVPIHVVDFRLVQQRGQRRRLDPFGPQQGGQFRHDAVGDLGRQAADHERPAAERSPPACPLRAAVPSRRRSAAGPENRITDACP